MKKLIGLLLFGFVVSSFNKMTGYNCDHVLFQETDTIKKTRHIDSATIFNIGPYFKIKKDEFEKCIWYTPRTILKQKYYGILFYFMDTADGPKNMRVKLQYAWQDWIFFYKVKILIDGKDYEYVPKEVRRLVGNGTVQEYSDESATTMGNDMLKALYYSKEIKIRFIGKDFSHSKKLGKRQVGNIKRSFDMFKALGGDLPWD